MHILVLSFYFAPDLSAGSFRATALVENLSGKLSSDDQVTVITTMPNRYATFRPPAASVEPRSNCTIMRIELPSHASGMADQSRAFLAYARGVLRAVERLNCDLVFATSSRLMTAALAAFVSRRLKVPLYLDIRDIFTETMGNLFAGRPHRAVLPLLRVLESWTMRSAARVNLVSPGFIAHFRALRSDLEYRTFTNGVDRLFLETDFDHTPEPRQPKVILYAGNIGEGQGLERIVPDAARLLGPEYEFWIIGDGGRRAELSKTLAEAKVSNVRIMDPVSREELVTLYRRADVLFLHLNDYPAFEKVLPSKIFEYAATGKPMLAGVAGYARQFIGDNVSNAAVFPPCDAHALCKALDSLQPGSSTCRYEFGREYGRDAIIDRLAEDVMELARASRG